MTTISYPGTMTTPITFGDTPAADAFGRLRVSDANTIFDSHNQYDLAPLVWDSTTLNSGTGTVTHVPNEAAAQLSTGGTASGAKAVRQTKQYHRYQPGKSHLILITGILGSPTTNLRRRLGYFDADDGIFLEQTSDGLHIVRRSSTSGSPVDVRVYQSDWNIDRFDGKGPSAFTLDQTKTQILYIDLEWLGVGRVRVGFVINGCFCVAHEFNNANNLTVPYMKTANLPIRCEIENTGITSGTNTLKQICCSVMSEGGKEEDNGYPFSASNGATSKNAPTSRTPILSIRPKKFHPSATTITNRGHLEPIEVSIIANGNAYYELVYNSIIATTAVWTSVATSSITEYDVTATSFTNGTTIHSGYISTSGGTARGISGEDILGRVTLVVHPTATNVDTFTVAATALTGTVAVNSSINWREQY